MPGFGNNRNRSRKYLTRLSGHCSGYGAHMLPSSVDLRKWDTPVKDQGDLGSCTAFMATGVIGFVRNVLGLPPLDLSELFIYYNERLRLGTVGKDSGAGIGDAFSVLAAPGSCQASLWPYDVARFTEQPPFECFADAALDVAVQEFALDYTLDAIKSNLAEGFPVGFGFDVYESFKTIGADGIMPFPNTDSEDFLGGHAVIMVGFDDATQSFLVRNSWSAAWGWEGYFWMPYKVITDPNGMAGEYMTVRRIAS